MSFTGDAVKSFSFVMLVIFVIHALLERTEKVERFQPQEAEVTQDTTTKIEEMKIEEVKDELYEFAIAEDEKNKIKKEEPVAAFGGGSGSSYGGFAPA
jgi:hypothetical protein